MSAVHIGSSDTDPACRRDARISEATTLQARPAQIVATMEHVLDTPGYIAADFHMHADPSLDSDLSLETRVAAAAAATSSLPASPTEPWRTPPAWSPLAIRSSCPS